MASTGSHTAETQDSDRYTERERERNRERETQRDRERERKSLKCPIETSSSNTAPLPANRKQSLNQLTFHETNQILRKNNV